MLRIGWFSTGRGEGSQKLLRAVVEAIGRGHLDGTIAFVVSNRERGQSAGTDRFFDQVQARGLSLVTLSDHGFRKAQGGEAARAGRPLPAWRWEYDAAVVELLQPYAWDIGVLAGYMLITTPPLYAQRPLLNLHPAAPDGPAGTWQSVTWQLIEGRATRSGVRIHLVTGELDDGPIVTYCTYPLRDRSIDPLWRAVDGRRVEEIRDSEGEANPLFVEIRRRGAAREIPLVVETLRAVADRKILIDNPSLAGEGPGRGARDLTERIESALAKQPTL